MLLKILLKMLYESAQLTTNVSGSSSTSVNFDLNRRRKTTRKYRQKDHQEFRMLSLLENLLQRLVLVRVSYLRRLKTNVKRSQC